MPRPANALLDYAAIADIQMSIDYSALASDAHHARVLRSLDRRIRVDRAFSFVHELQDAWYDLHNPDRAANRTTAVFTISRADFEPNSNDPVISGVTLFYVPTPGIQRPPATALQTSLTLRPPGGAGGVNAVAQPIDLLATSAFGAWIPFIGQSPIGEWELAVPGTVQTRELFQQDVIMDLLLILSVEATRDPWPNETTY